MSWFHRLSEMTGEEIIVKDSLTYAGNWVHHLDATMRFPIQRRLTTNECVLDYDGVTEGYKLLIINYLKDVDFKFSAWDSSETGLHIHFWTNLTSKHMKVALVLELNDRLVAKFGQKLQTDTAPIKQGVIRAEDSMHPVKGDIKTLREDNLGAVYFNYVSTEMCMTLNGYASDTKQVDANTGPRDTGAHGCVTALETTPLTDGRKRALFALISYYKGDSDIVEKLGKWMSFQGMTLNTGTLRALIRSNSGKVGCRYRHELLDELGVEWIE